MNTQTMTATMAVVLLGIFNQAHAAPRVFLYPYPPHQVADTAYARAGLTVIGQSSWTSLTVAGGFTMTCGAQVITAENAAHAGFLAGDVAEFVDIPDPQPADYNVGGFSTLASGGCRDCTFQYRGRVYEGVATINATSRGAGFVFAVNGVDMTKSDTSTFSICKPFTSVPTPRGCTQ